LHLIQTKLICVNLQRKPVLLSCPPLHFYSAVSCYKDFSWTIITQSSQFVVTCHWYLFIQQVSPALFPFSSVKIIPTPWDSIQIEICWCFLSVISSFLPHWPLSLPFFVWHIHTNFLIYSCLCICLISLLLIYLANAFILSSWERTRLIFFKHKT
jgi:hypothetical protein